MTNRWDPVIASGYGSQVPGWPVPQAAQVSNPRHDWWSGMTLPGQGNGNYGNLFGLMGMWNAGMAGSYGSGPPWMQGMTAPPTGYHLPAEKNFDISASNLSVDPMSVVEATKPLVNEQMNRGFASAAARMGQMGMLTSSGYSQALGGVARKASNDLARLYYQTRLQAAENQAQREMQARLANQGAGLQEYLGRGGWDTALQRAQMENAFRQWQQTGNWGQAWADMLRSPMNTLLGIAGQNWGRANDPQAAWDILARLQEARWNHADQLAPAIYRNEPGTSIEEALRRALEQYYPDWSQG